MRLLRLSSMRSSTRGPKSHRDNLDTQSLEQSSSIEMSDASPNFMKATNSSHAKETFESSQRLFARKSLTRVPTLKLKRSLTRKLSGGTELKRKLKSSRSIKLATVKGLRSTRQGKNQYMANTFNDGQNSKSPSENSQRVITRRLSFKPVRISSRMSIFKLRKSSIEKSPEILQSLDSSLHKATCSSTLKDSHFSDQIELPLEGSGSQGVSLTRKVCPYTYCSLHGGHRDNVPPLKRFMSMRRRQLKTQKNMEIRPVSRSKHSGNTKKGTQTNWSIHNEDPANITAHSGTSHLRNIKKRASNSPVRSCDALVSTSTGGGSSGGEDKEHMNFRYNAEVLLGETSFPHISFDQYLNDSLAENGYSLSSFLAIKETNTECCCCTAADKDKPDSKVIGIARNDVAAHEKNDAGIQSVPLDDQPDIMNPELMQLEDFGLCGKHSLTDDSVVAGNEVLGVEASQEKQEQGNSILILKLTNSELSGEGLNAVEFRSVSDQLSDKSKASVQNDVAQLTSTTATMCSAPKLQTLGEEIAATKDQKMDPDCEILHETSQHRESKPASTTDVSYRMREGDKKYIKMWHLMYKHAVGSNTGKGEDKLPSDGEDKEAQGKGDLLFNGVNNSCCQDTDDENETVVELVQKAFDEILLPEMEDVSSDDHLKSRGMASEEEFLEKSQGKEGDGNTSTSRESATEEERLKVDNSQSHEEEKASQMMGDKPEPKAPKSWSNLKKLLLLKKFVKALEKVKKLNLRKPRHLPSDANLEAEQVYLRHLTPKEKKNVEEWMLDRALQKVISKLAPAQKRRVALLVEAFETILPFHDTENGPPSSAAIETQVNAVQALKESSDHSDKVTGRERDYDFSAKLLLGKALRSHKSFEEHADNAGNNPMTEGQISHVIEEVNNNPASRVIEGDWNVKQSLASNYDKRKNNSIVDHNVCLAETKDSVSLSSATPVDIIRTFHEEDPTSEIVNEAPRYMISDSSTEIPSSESESHEKNFETKNLISASEEPLSMSKSLILKGFARSLGSNLASSADKPVADRKESIVKAKPETKNLEQFPIAEETEIQQEKQNPTGLWYLVYKHMASGIAANDFKPLMDGDDKRELGYYGGRITGTDTSLSYESIPVESQVMPSKDHPIADSDAELRQMEAIKIVEEAIDAILPDVQEHSPDDQSITDSMISDNSKQSHRTKGAYGEDRNQEKERVTSGDRITQELDEEEPALKEVNKPLPRSWSNLKKVIMLRRFIKALEKVRKFNPRGPRYLPAEPDPEAEKVNLRHQDMGERKGSEEWMLDHAIRQVVAKLTPDRKRKVELLVEAFETVMPTIKN